MKIVVTGAASPLGRSVVDRLVHEGHGVVGIIRRLGGVKQMERLGAQWIMADVRKPEPVAKALAGADIVLHLAGYFDFWEPRDGVYESVNVGATRNVLAAALVSNVRRVVVCSSAITIGEPAGTMGDEFSRHRGHTRTALERSKLEAERLALRVRSRGVEVVVVNPGLVVAPRDPGWVGRLLSRTVAGKRPLASRAPLGWIWVEDAAKGIIRAATVGADGARYILCGETMSSRRFLEKLAASVGAPPPKHMPRQLAMFEAALQTAVALPGHKRPRLALDEARFLTNGFAVDGSHARHELGLDYTPSSRYIPALAQSYAQALNRFDQHA